ncbi:MAG: DUF1553 domain-containing protein [Pedosphaera sp.]|nr:DUF1553 domain-containing protein [Pedosphaera sp.]
MIANFEHLVIVQLAQPDVKPNRQTIARCLAAVFGILLPCQITFAAEPPVSFRTDVMPLLSKLGCNAGTCHGNANGKGGFKLSLRGQDPDLDWIALTRDQSGRRVNPLDPPNSLFLLKSTTGLAHEGGQRLRPDSDAWRTLTRWIANGAKDDGATALKLARLEVTPPEQVLIEPKREVKLQARAIFTDGSERDVSRLAVYDPANLLVSVSPDGLVTSQRPGETTVIVRFLEKQTPVRLAFVPKRPAFKWSSPPENNFIDHEVFAKLRTLRMNPAPLCSDEIFLRRAHLDLLGLIPTGDEARAFLADTAPGKRTKLVETLLQRPEFVDFWTLKWADLLRIEERQLDAKGMQTFHQWIHESIAANKPLDQFARELVSARGSTYTNAPANWYRANRTAVQRAENTAQLFLGARLNCAQCHNHPFERWTQDDYHNWTAVFARVDYKILENKRKDESDKQEFKGDQIVFLTNSASWINPRLGKPATPRLLGGSTIAELKLPVERDELDALADWLTRRENPWFAKMQANRIWFHLMGRGLVDPVDDFRASNPPSHPELITALARELADHHFDMRHLIRVVMNSRAYQLASETNETNGDDEINYSHNRLRRLGAEQLLDSQCLATGAALQLKDQPKLTRISEMIEGRKHYKPLTSTEDKFLAAFGKPPRLVCSESERSNDTTMGQAFQFVSGPLLNELLTRQKNRLGRLVASGQDERAMLTELYWATLSRPPAGAELGRLAPRLKAANDKRAALEDIEWALLNSKEFVFRR